MEWHALIVSRSHGQWYNHAPVGQESNLVSRHLGWELHESWGARWVSMNTMDGGRHR